jgi:hypothetical protein
MKAADPRFAKLQAFLNSLRIPTEKAGFFDHPAFLAVEQKAPSFLDEYARFVHWKPYDAEYLHRAEKISRIVANELHRGLVLEGRLGGCIDTSMTMGRILDLYGVWNCVVRGAFRITFPAGSGHRPISFVPIDIADGSGKEYGHKWLFAPPFQIIDVTLKLQDYDKPVHGLLPEQVLEKSLTICLANPEDIISSAAIQVILRQGGTPKQALKFHFPKYMDGFADDFPAHLLKQESGLLLKYIPVGFGTSECPLKTIQSYMVKGKTSYQYYQEEIKPKLVAAGFEETLDENEFPGGLIAGTTKSLGSTNASSNGAPALTSRERAEERKKKRKSEKRKGK